MSGFSKGWWFGVLSWAWSRTRIACSGCHQMTNRRMRCLQRRFWLIWYKNKRRKLWRARKKNNHIAAWKWMLYNLIIIYIYNSSNFVICFVVWPGPNKLLQTFWPLLDGDSWLTAATTKWWSRLSTRSDRSIYPGPLQVYPAVKSNVKMPRILVCTKLWVGKVGKQNWLIKTFYSRLWILVNRLVRDGWECKGAVISESVECFKDASKLHIQVRVITVHST